MSKAQGWVAIVLLIAAIAVGIYGRAVPAAWDYRIAFYGASDAQMIRDGWDGWEIVSARWAQSGALDPLGGGAWGYECILRRRK